MMGKFLSPVREVYAMTLFTVGPVQMYPETLRIEGEQLPYFRTPEFSAVMKDNEAWFLESLHAPAGSRFIGLTTSGTGAMDAVVSNVLTKEDRVLVIDGGSFGNRFSKICSFYGIPHEDYQIPFLHAFNKEEFARYDGRGFTALLVNACDTSTGQLYDLDYLGDFCARNGMLFIVDAVSAYLCDPIDMEKQKIDVVLTASQKALALSPGTALVALSERSVARLGRGPRAYYLDFDPYLKDQMRGQPPYTSSVGTMLALHQRLESIRAQGVANVTAEIRGRAEHFRKLAARLPLEIPDIPLSSGCTPILFPKKNATAVYEALRSKYGLYLTPSGGDWKDLQLRVGHMGNLTLADFDDLAEKLVIEM